MEMLVPCILANSCREKNNTRPRAYGISRNAHLRPRYLTEVGQLDLHVVSQEGKLVQPRLEITSDEQNRVVISWRLLQ